jgi:hypothetical protein
VVGDDSRVRLQNVTTGITDADRVQVLTGLKDGDRVVVDGTDRLQPGTQVRVRRAGELDEINAELGRAGRGGRGGRGKKGADGKGADGKKGRGGQAQ